MVQWVFKCDCPDGSRPRLYRQAIRLLFFAYAAKNAVQIRGIARPWNQCRCHINGGFSRLLNGTPEQRQCRLGSIVQLAPNMRMKTEVSTQATIAAQSSVLLLTKEPMDLEQNVIRVYGALRTPVCQYLAATFGDPTEAEDLTQETFLRLYLYWSSGKTIADNRLRSWVFRVAHNLAVDRTRSTKFIYELASEDYRTVALQVPDSGRDPEETLLDRERFNAIRKGLALLSAQESRCLHLRAEGFCYREIAEILNITSSSVAEFLRRAMRKMAR